VDNLRLALRTLWRAPGFTAAAVLVLAIGVGASTAVFSILRSVVLRPLGMPHAEQLVRLYERPAGMDVRWPWSAPEYLDLGRESGAFESVAAIRAGRQTLTGRASPTQIRIARVTASFFSTLRSWPVIGRAPDPEEDAAGGPRTAVLTNGVLAPRVRGGPLSAGAHADPRRAQLHHRRRDAGGLPPSAAPPGRRPAAHGLRA